MKPETLICTLAIALASLGAQAVTPIGSERPYTAIVDRNVFNLRPPPAPVDPSELARNKQIPKLTLNGITTILGKKIVFITMPSTKPGGPPQTLMLAEGQAEEEVEAKQIDEKAGVVKVNNHGEEQTLDFDHDGTKPAGPAGNPASPMTFPPVPSAPPANTMPFPQPVRPLRTLPSRTTPLSGGENNSAFGGGMAGSGLAGASAQDPQPLTPEQQALVIEAQRMKAIQDNDPISRILPMTPHTQEMLDGMQNPAPQ